MAINTVNSKGITDATITEDDIAISNAPADGKFLQYKDSSDKLTWADVPAGVGGATGADFNDDVKVRFGTGNDAEIYHNGSNLNIDNADGHIMLQAEANMGFSFNSGSVQLAEFLAGAYDISFRKPIAIEGPDADTGGQIKIYESDSHLDNYVIIEANGTMGANYTFTLPAAVPTANGQTLTATTAGVTSWADPAAGATGGGSDKIFWENGQTVTTDYTITNNNNAGTWGPVTINSGVTVTVGDGEYWTIM